MKLTFVWITLLFSLTARAVIPCDSSVLASEALYTIPGAGYWMQAFGECRITYTGTNGFKSAMYNLCTRSSERITNHIDAFGFPEGDLYVQPTGKGLSFFSTDDLVRDADKTQPFYSDFTHGGNYESLGFLSKTDKERKVRIVIAKDSVRFKDYAVRKIQGKYQVKPDQIYPVPLCKNLASDGLVLQLPTVSRDGRRLAARQTDSEEMNIYDIDVRSNTCSLAAKIPIITGKVTFTFDNKNVLFVAMDPVTQKGRLFQFDIATGKLKTISGPQENVQNVTAKNTGEIFYSRQSENGDENSSTLVKLAELPTAKEEGPYKALGSLWAKSCGLKIDLDSAAAVGQRLTADACRKVVSEGNLDGLSDLKGFTKDQLKETCASKSPASNVDARKGLQ